VAAPNSLKLAWPPLPPPITPFKLPYCFGGSLVIHLKHPPAFYTFPPPRSLLFPTTRSLIPPGIRNSPYDASTPMCLFSRGWGTHFPFIPSPAQLTFLVSISCCVEALPSLYEFEIFLLTPLVLPFCHSPLLITLDSIIQFALVFSIHFCSFFQIC